MVIQMQTDVLAEAAAWHVRLKTGGDADWDGFVRWLEGDPARADAYDKVEAGHAAMTAEAFAAAARPAPVQAANDDMPAPSWWHTRWAAGLAVAAGLMLVLLASLPLLLAPRDLYEVATAAGQQRQVDLGDGSAATLNGATRLRLDRDDPRYAELLSGEATFVVRHDESDPFIVMAGDHELRDVGTSFNVVHEGGDLSLEVIEGAVLFDPDAAAVRVDAGRTLRVDGAEAPVLAEADPAMMAGWRHGRLNYAAAPLGRVAGDMSRTLGVAVTVDQGLRQLSFTGSIRIQPDAGATVADLAASLGLAARHQGSGWVIERAAR